MTGTRVPSRLTRERFVSKSGDVVKGLLLFAALGPAVGSFAVSAFMLAAPVLDGTRFHGESTVGTLMVILGVMMFAYPLGVIPAAIVGSVLGLYRTRLVNWKAFVAAGIFASVMTYLYGILWVASSVSLVDAMWPALFVWAFPGLLAGVVCAYFFQPFSYQRGRPSTIEGHCPE